MFFIRHIIPTRNTIRAGLLLLAFLLPHWLLADDAHQKQLSDKVANVVQNIGNMLTATPPDSNGALNIINNLIGQVAPDSFDMAYLSQMKAQALIDAQDIPGSVPSLETALNLSQRYGYFEKRANLGIMWMLAQIYAQDAGNEKNPAFQQQKYAKALAMLRSWLAQTPAPTQEAYSYAANILYQQAMANPKNPDKSLLSQAEAQAQNALSMVAKPNASAYQLLVAIAQARNDPETSAKYLEILVQNNPRDSSYWNMLLSCYLSDINSTPDGSFLRSQAYAKALYTIKRAQQNGFMQKPSDYNNVVAIYVQANQYEGAVDTLQASLHNNKMDPRQYSNWELLAQCYLQLNDTQKAIDTYKEAQKFFPNDGNIDMQIGNLYYNKQQYQPALAAMLDATKKNVDARKAPSLYSFIAYIYLQLEEYDKATAAIDKSLELDPNARDAKGIQSAIQETVAMRNAMLKAGVPAATAAAQQPPAADQGQPQTKAADAQPGA